jgi:hypothetical protein
MGVECIVLYIVTLYNEVYNLFIESSLLRELGPTHVLDTFPELSHLS